VFWLVGLGNVRGCLTCDLVVVGNRFTADAIIPCCGVGMVLLWELPPEDD